MATASAPGVDFIFLFLLAYLVSFLNYGLKFIDSTFQACGRTAIVDYTELVYFVHFFTLQTLKGPSCHLCHVLDDTTNLMSKRCLVHL